MGWTSVDYGGLNARIAVRFEFAKTTLVDSVQNSRRTVRVSEDKMRIPVRRSHRDFSEPSEMQTHVYGRPRTLESPPNSTDPARSQLRIQQSSRRGWGPLVWETPKRSDGDPAGEGKKHDTNQCLWRCPTASAR